MPGKSSAEAALAGKFLASIWGEIGMEKSNAASEALEIIRDVPVSILITHGKDGFPAARPMGHLLVEDDLTVYFATSTRLAKCGQMKANPNVAVYWEKAGRDRHGYAWVMVQGTAELTQERGVLDRFWDDSFTHYFPEGRSDPRYVIIRVTPKRLTVLSGAPDMRAQVIDLA
jgi:general stress protein 26